MLNQITYEYYDTVDSTNDRIKDRARQNDESGGRSLFLQATQTAGEGTVYGEKIGSHLPTDSISYIYAA
jgi:hypothetical protein